MRSTHLLTATLLAARVAAGQGAPTHPFGADDYAHLREAHAVAVSPDGRTILYDVQYFGASGPAKHESHVIGMAGDQDRKLALDEQFHPSGFMPGGEALYGSMTVDGQSQLAIASLSPGPPIRIMSFPRGVTHVAISPDGKRFAMLVDPRPKDTLDAVRKVVENDVSALFVLALDGTGGRWCPSLDHIANLAWSPDGQQIAVASSTPKIGHHDVRDAIDICTATATKRVTEFGAPTGGLAWTDGGRTLVMASTATHTLTPDHVWTVSVDGGLPTDRTPDLSGSAVSVVGDPMGSVWAEVHRGVTIEVDRFQDGRLTPTYRWPNGVIARPPVFPEFAGSPEALAFTVGDPTHAENVAVNRGDHLERVTREGDDVLAKVALGEVRVVHWTAKDGTALEGILTLPAGYQSGTHVPFTNLPHGGPESNDALELDFLSRFVAGLGYVVLQPEYRGSTGYGSSFLEAIYQHFGDRAFGDVNSATDYAVTQGWADPNRLTMFGWSAGGFMTAWTVTQTHRYRAAVEGAGITDWLSFIPASDIAQVDYDARLQEQDPAPFLRFSAVMHTDQVTTPLLILQGEADLRVPAFQSREFFVLLAERGKTVREVTYPGSPHFPTRIEQRLNVLHEVEDWFAQHNGA